MDPTASGASATAGAATRTHRPSIQLHRPKAAATTRSAAVPRTTARPGVRTATAAGRFAAVERALRSHKVLALPFYNPSAPDDHAVRQELGTVPPRGGDVFKLAIPLDEIHNYVAIANQVPVNVSPTLVLVAPSGQVDEIVGYTDRFGISQRVDDALAVWR